MTTGTVAAAPPASLIAFGSNNQIANLCMGDVAGGNISKVYNTVLAPAAPPQIERLPDVPLPPRALRGFRDREPERTALGAELRPGGGVWLRGTAGSGLTALLREAANLPTANLPDGVVFLEGNRLPLNADNSPTATLLDDLTQRIFDSFYRSSDPTRRIILPAGQALPHLRRLRALVALDRMALGQNDAAALSDALAGGCVLFTGDGDAPQTLRDLPLAGLPRPDALALLAGVGMTPPPDQALLERLAAALDDYPLPLLLAARFMAAGRVPLARMVELLEQIKSQRDPLTRLLRFILTGLDADERLALQALVGVGGPDATLEALAATSQRLPELLEAALKRLDAIDLVQANAGRYSLVSPGVRVTLARLLRPGEERKRAAAFFGAAAVAHGGNPAWLGQELGNLLAAAHSAVAEGQHTLVGQLAQAMQPGLVQGGQWGSWGQLVQWAEGAARSSGDQRLLAWALHEQGTRAGLLHGSAAAEAPLREALCLRQGLGDQAASALTEGNLRYFGLLPPLKPPKLARRWGPLRLLAAAAGGLATLLVLAVVVLAIIFATRPGATLGVINQNCTPLRLTLPVSIPRVSLPDQAIGQGQRGEVSLPAFAVEVDGTAFPRLTIAGLMLVTIPIDLGATQVRDLLLDGTTLVGQRRQLDLRDQPDHELVVICQ
ncbi:MAG: hypothetical protein MUD01_04375 [Chloroflexaceae bacterium]|jgi:hypothetical protein|nr:hypothetical protein [Chloroflexaceae bacterium]